MAYEIVNSRGDWIEERRGKWVLAIIDRPEQFDKGRSNRRWLELSEELVEEFHEDIGTQRYLVANGKAPTARQNAIYRNRISICSKTPSWQIQIAA